MDPLHAWSKRLKSSAGVVSDGRRSVSASTLGSSVTTRRSPSKRVLLGAAALLMPFVLGGCQLPTFWGYRGSTKQAHSRVPDVVLDVHRRPHRRRFRRSTDPWAVIRYRRQSEEIPRQFQYHGPVEVLYTIIPIVIVLVIFAFTVVTENNIDALASSPAAQVKITAFQWGWEFQYPNQNIIVLGHTTQDPDLVLPVR